MVYLFPLVLVLLLSYQYDYRGHIKGRIEWYIFLLLYCILVAGLRYRIGGDTVMYSDSYDRLPNLWQYYKYDFTNEKFGRAYVLLCAIARSISNNFILLQFILAIILNCVIFKFIYQNTKNIFIGVFLYMILLYFNLNMEVLRESMAIVCFLLGWKYFYNRKWFQYYILSILAILFHPSSIFILLLPICTCKWLNKFFSFSWISILSAFVLFFGGIILTAKSFDLIRVIGIATLDNYADLYEATGFAEGKSYHFFGIIDLLNYIIYPFIICWLITQQMNLSNKIHKNYYQSLIAMVIVYSYIGVLSSSLIILYRLNNYMMPFIIIATADTIYHSIHFFKYKFCPNYFLWQFFILPIVVIPIWRLYVPSGISATAPIHRYAPYYSIISYHTDPEREKIHLFYANK